MNQTQVAALIAELNAMPAGLYSCDANGSACTSYVAQWKVVELVEKQAALAQQAQEPVWANDYVTKVHAQIEHLLNDLITTQVSCNLPYYGIKTGMLTNNWVSALKRLHAEYPSPPSLQPAVPVVSNEQIDPLVQKHARATWSGSQQDWDVAEFSRLGLVMFANAILALRPAVEPMANERLAEVLTTAYGSPEWTMDDVRAARAVEAAVNGITAKAEGGAKP